MERLDANTFEVVLRATPLVSIDLLVTEPGGRVLVGRRANEPAKGWYFVPGGRIRKDERLADALPRIAEHEVGLDPGPWDPARVVSVAEHFYDANALGIAGLSTHYVVVAYRVDVDDLDLERLRTQSPQHTGFRWYGAGDDDADVHPYTRAYVA